MTKHTFNVGTFGRDLRTARHPWPSNCHIQGGGDGLVMRGGSMEEVLGNQDKALEVVGAMLGSKEDPDGSYRTAFFEAFPREPDTFIRGEGRTVEDAEDSAWAQFQKYASCRRHEFERRGYHNGAGLCRHCGMFGSKVFITTDTPCSSCGDDLAAHMYGNDAHGKPHCKACSMKLPEEQKGYTQKMVERWRREDGNLV